MKLTSKRLTAESSRFSFTEGSQPLVENLLVFLLVAVIHNSMWIVYQHTNLKNGKSYIGCTSKGLEKRWNDHVKNSKSGSTLLFHRAIKKYGAGCWDSKILFECASKEEAFQKEVEMIESLRTYTQDHPENGYNMTRGGEGPTGNIYNHTQEAREKISRSLIGRVVSEETRKKISESRKGRTVSDETKLKLKEASTGKKLSEETRRKMSDSRKGKALTEEHKQKISISRRANAHGADFQEGESLQEFHDEGNEL